MELFTFRLTGVSPILQNNPAKMAAGGSDGLKTGKKKYIPADEAEAACYRNDRGELYIPSMAVRAALLRACSNRKIGKAFAKGLVSASVFPTETECVLLDPKGKPITKCEIHTVRAVVQRMGVMRTRALVKHWSCDFAADIDTDAIGDVQIVEDLLNVAGRIIGVMDWRPEKMGIYGRFTAKLATAAPASKRRSA